MTALNPVVTVGEQVSEMFLVHEGVSKAEAMNRAIEMLRQVHIPYPEKRAKAPLIGMRQRVMIAISLPANLKY